VLVIADAPETKTAGGILLTTGVSAVGADVKAVKAGDKVLVNGFAGSDIELDDGSKGKFLTEDDILAVVS
jgi:chaperonin GroES